MDLGKTTGSEEGAMADHTACPITGDENSLRVSAGDYREYDCPTCGRFRISGTALALAGANDQDVLRAALDVARHSTPSGQVPMISNLSG